MMFKSQSKLITVVLLALTFDVTFTFASPAIDNSPASDVTPDQFSAYEMFCKEYNHLQLCKLEFTLQQALAELQYIILNEDPVEDNGNLKTKRKSAFVRFGKRNAQDDLLFDKRKSAFVRFGRSIDDRIDGQKRKSSYVRFG